MARAMRAAVTPALLVALLALAASAAGSVKCAPPGVSGVSQYFETLPGLSCNVPSPRPGHAGAKRRRGHPGAVQPASGGGGSSQALDGSSQTPGGSLPPATSQQLGRRGGAGQAVQRLVAQTGTAPGHRADSAGGVLDAAPAVSGSGQGALGGLVHPLLSGSARGGAGPLLPLLLGVSVLVVLAISILRRRRRATP